MKSFLSTFQLVIAILLIVLIILQGRGAGLGSGFGGAGELYRTKRGFERLLFILAIVFIAFFFVVSIANLLTG